MNEMCFQAVEFKTNLIIQVNNTHAKNTVLKPKYLHSSRRSRTFRGAGAEKWHCEVTVVVQHTFSPREGRTLALSAPGQPAGLAQTAMCGKLLLKLKLDTKL